MKQILTFFSTLFLFCASALAVPEYGRFTDVLNPDYQRRIDEYLRVIDHWMEDGATYTLKETKFSRTMYIRAPHFLYRKPLTGAAVSVYRKACCCKQRERQRF